MATAGITVGFNEKDIIKQFKQVAERYNDRVHKAAALTAAQAQQEIQEKGRADIAAGGNFGSRWTDGFHARIIFEGRQYRIQVYSDVPYFNIFEYGGIIRGRPMLWIPLSFARDALGVLARNFPGGLFRVDRLSGAAPLLLSPVDRQPKYFGKEQVTMPKKFHIRRIIREAADNMNRTFKNNLRRLGTSHDANR
jgi:hypothetical protein